MKEKKKIQNKNNSKRNKIYLSKHTRIYNSSYHSILYQQYNFFFVCFINNKKIKSKS
jgi:hypothetical protein